MLVDLDVVFSDVTAAVGIDPDDAVRTIDELSPLGDELSTSHLDEVLWHHPKGFEVLLAPAETRVPWSGAETYRRAIVAARRMCDVVVLHVPRALDEVARTGLAVSDRILLVLGLDVLSFRDAKRAVAVAGLDDRCAFVINRAMRSKITPRDVERVFGKPPIAVIPSDKRVPALQDRGKLLPMRGRVGRAMSRLASAALEGDR